MTSPRRSPAGLIILGVAALTAASPFDGLLRGLLLGAGLALVLLGAYLSGHHQRRTRPHGRGEAGPWLPSRDETR
ncbi:hypothetical protein [Nocardioides marmoribigeumensis]|jgi:hypothetical protein|uniref:DUF3040 domain-containing protein n=1 Tax=Nocardioides marmoribigeumensis TaxID=433649 RepID=A0ABU2BVW9_9ACTN|nr:hypothetical protein [Nocardioides marmoribigeumensis]MDR7362784.1 hypothetical protein [Nocardioides marmoribigeumensis]